jgi:FAD/FMN-containing dehydrogenase
MGDGLTGRVVEPGQPGYDEARLDYNLAFDDIYPRYIVFCESPEDVANAVRFARAHELPIRARSGRHSYEAYSIVDGGVVIDVSAMHAVVLNAKAGTARIEAGANLGTVYHELWDQGRVAIPGGTCGGVGIAGLTLGGGFGFLGRAHGLACDRLVALEMIDAGGHRVLADDRSRPDLMWASRGGGGNNFGVVTAFEFRVVPVGDVSVFRILWPWQELPKALDTFQRWADPVRLDRRLGPVMNLKAKSAGNVAVFGQFLGAISDLERLIRPLLSVGSPTEVELQRMTFIQAVDYFGGAAPAAQRWTVQATAEPGEPFKDTSAYQYRLFPRAAIQVMRDHLADTPSPACLIEVDTYGGQVAALRDDATAFPHRRGVRSALQPQAYWEKPEQAAAHRAWVESLRQGLLPFTHGGYLNYIDRDVKDWPRFYYGQNLDRLLRIKRRYDPQNVFDFPQGLGRLV